MGRGERPCEKCVNQLALQRKGDLNKEENNNGPPVVGMLYVQQWTPVRTHPVCAEYRTECRALRKFNNGKLPGRVWVTVTFEEGRPGTHPEARVGQGLAGYEVVTS